MLSSSYILQNQNFLNSTLKEISEFQKSHGALEAYVISMQRDTSRLDKCQGELSFVVKPITREKKERTEEAIGTWLGQ